MIAFESRASLILYNYLKSNQFPHKFILPLNVCPIVPATFLKAKVEFEFIDISPLSLCIDETLLLERIQQDPQISGVLFVNTFGIELDNSVFFQTIKTINKEIAIIDDCCLKIPNFNYQIKNSVVDLALFSTGYSKYVDIAWGGFGFLSDSTTYSQHPLAFNPKDLVNFSKMTQAAIDTERFLDYPDNDWLGSEIQLYSDFNKYKQRIQTEKNKVAAHKKKLNTIYQTMLPSSIQLGDKFSNWRFSILVPNKEELLKELFKNHLFASSHYKAIDFMFKKKPTPDSQAKTIHDHIINLFNDFRFSETQAHAACRIINQLVN
ncbi:DegT/DnrJ/EryC1/StrS aminotransferase family protein [Legionella sp. km772]|uniref:DegT/DnrJ/EryC1/StrS aminotransferase family protein n=1 Tax=Legionella sp. km772 TaxID=2498111 RepID=UPI000F8DA3ED|nr:DegT/DnrJ/EryC1/StrS aminotransferase family protein [Legionella sp. km772]RUR08123.1 DegT/DnrJ/EryC1/StrS aminotransferase family protein [Legionella sp. km772]